jgi:hypothetical protein
MAHLAGTDDGVGYGVEGISQSNGGSGVVGFAHGPVTATELAPGVPTAPLRVGVYGVVDAGTGVLGQNGAIGTVIAPGAAGSGHVPQGSTVGAIWGDSKAGNGVYGSSAGWNGVEGDSWSAAHAGVAGQNNAGGPGVWGSSSGNAGQFEGNVLVTGTLTVNQDILLPGADCAEQFDVAGERQIGPGTVVVIDRDGALRESRDAYDRKVAGVVSGAGEYKPGIVLDRGASDKNRMPVALVGKVYCKVDAQYASVEVGDLLTASPTPGHAMKAVDPLRAFGAVIGKALRPLQSGTALIPVLVALQ